VLQDPQEQQALRVRRGRQAPKVQLELKELLALLVLREQSELPARQERRALLD